MAWVRTQVCVWVQHPQPSGLSGSGVSELDELCEGLRVLNHRVRVGVNSSVLGSQTHAHAHVTAFILAENSFINAAAVRYLDF